MRCYVDVDGEVRRPTAVLPRFGSTGTSAKALAEWFSVAASTTAKGMRVVVADPEPVAAATPRSVAEVNEAPPVKALPHAPPNTALAAALAEVARAIRGRALPFERFDRNDGYCYLELVADEYQDQAARRYGAWPVFGDLVDMPLEWFRPPEECVRVGVAVRGEFLHFQYGGGDGQLSAYDLLVYARAAVTRARGATSLLPEAIMSAKVGGGSSVCTGAERNPGLGCAPVVTHCPIGELGLRPPDIVVGHESPIATRFAHAACDATESGEADASPTVDVSSVSSTLSRYDQLGDCGGADDLLSEALRRAYLATHCATSGSCLRVLFRKLWGPVGRESGPYLTDILPEHLIRAYLQRAHGELPVTVVDLHGKVCVLEGHHGESPGVAWHTTLREHLEALIVSPRLICRNGIDTNAVGRVCDECGFRVLKSEGHRERCRLPNTVMPAMRDDAWIGDALHVLDVRVAIQDAGVDSAKATVLAVSYLSASAQARYMREFYPDPGDCEASDRVLSARFEAGYVSRYRDAYLVWLRKQLGLH